MYVKISLKDYERLSTLLEEVKKEIDLIENLRLNYDFRYLKLLRDNIDEIDTIIRGATNFKYPIKINQKSLQWK